MTNKHKDIRDYVLTGLGVTGAAVGAAFVVAELPAVIVAGAGIIVAAGALQRLHDRSECCDDPECECHDK